MSNWDDDGGWLDDEDDSCLCCGEYHFKASRVPGLCVDCAAGGTDTRDDIETDARATFRS